MMAYLNRKNLLLAAVSAAILFYFSTIALVLYLLILLAVTGIFHRGSANGVDKLANFLTNTATLAVTILVLAVLLEIGLHLNPHFFIGNQAPDTMGEFADFTTRGYLTEEVFNKEKGVFRILGLGDSFAVYAPEDNIKHNYNSLLQEEFAALGRRKVEIINAGMPGVGPEYYRHTMEKYGDRLKPDLIMVGFFVGNDFDDLELSITFGNIISEVKDPLRKLRSYRNFQNFRLHKLVEGKYILYQERQRLAQEEKDKGGSDGGSFSTEAFLEIEGTRSWIFDKNKRTALGHKWQRCAGIISQMKQWCDDRNIDMVLLLFPDQFQVDEDLRASVVKKYHLAVESLELEYPNSLIAGFCRENHIHCLDMLAPFQEAARTMPLYVLRNTHWNEAGNRLAADLIFKYLEEHKLIKSD